MKKIMLVFIFTVLHSAFVLASDSSSKAMAAMQMARSLNQTQTNNTGTCRGIFYEFTNAFSSGVESFIDTKENDFPRWEEKLDRLIESVEGLSSASQSLWWQGLIIGVTVPIFCVAVHAGYAKVRLERAPGGV